MTTRRRAIGEGSIYFDESKNRWVGALMVDGKRRKVLGRTKTEARQRLDALRRRTDAGEQVGDGNATLADAIDKWTGRVLAAGDLAPATREVYGWAADRLRDELGKKRLRALTVDDVEAAFDRMTVGDAEHRPTGRAALVKVRSVLGQVLQFAERRGMVARNVARSAELTPTARRTPPRRSLTAEEARRLAPVLAADPLGIMFLVALTTGLRPGEAAGLTWDAIDLDNNTVTVSRAVHLEHGRPLLGDELKTAKSRRTVALPGHVVNVMRVHRRQQTAQRLAARRWDDERLVFASRNGTVLQPGNVRRALARLCAQAEVPTITPNELRHTAASLMSDDGVPLAGIADALGHVNTRMLEATYRHRLQPSVTAGVSTMDRLLDNVDEVG